MDSSGCWTKGGKYVAPESLLPYLAQQIHNLGHSGPATMNHRFSNQWWNQKIQKCSHRNSQEMRYMSDSSCSVVSGKENLDSCVTL